MIVLLIWRHYFTRWRSDVFKVWWEI